ncbi:hypothetical protein AN1V17_12990 [Vallitalea sediminicola]
MHLLNLRTCLQQNNFNKKVDIMQALDYNYLKKRKKYCNNSIKNGIMLSDLINRLINNYIM